MPEAQAAIKAGCHARRAAWRRRNACDRILVAAVHSHALCRAFAALLVNKRSLRFNSEILHFRRVNRSTTLHAVQPRSSLNDTCLGFLTWSLHDI